MAGGSVNGDSDSAVQIAADVLARRSHPGAAAMECADRIDRANPELKAFVDFDRGVLAPQIVALERRLDAGERPTLAGVPVAIKDHIMVEGWRYTEGSLLFRNRIADRDEPVVARLRNAGAILMGRVNMSEFGCKGVTSNRLYGVTVHPVDSALTPGGSSGGAASAVAARLVPLALASDGGGSVRRPAAHVGIVGLKPSTGVLADPRDFSHTSVFGILARSVADAMAMLQALAGCDPRDPVSLPDAAFAAAVPARAPLIAWSPRQGLDVAVDADVACDIERAMERLGEAGWRIERTDPAWPEGASENALMPIQYAALAAAHGASWLREPALFDPVIGRQIATGLALTGAEVAAAYALSVAIARSAAAFFGSGVDALLCPTVPCVAWPHARLDPETIGGAPARTRGHAVFTPFVNHAFCPAVSIPVPRAAGALPVGLQIVAPRLADRALLALALEAERILSRDR